MRRTRGGGVTLTGQRYSFTRPRGFALWRPQARTLALLQSIRDVLDEYADYLPLAARQAFYRLVGRHGFEKTERAYQRLLETLNRARRGGLIPFEAIRDDGATASEPRGFNGKPDFWRTVRAAAEIYQRDRSEGQPVALEVWCEAGGMVPQLERVAHPFGASVYSSGGFDSVTVKHEAAQRFASRSRPTIVLHIGDHDPSGCAIADSLAEDVAAFARELEGPAPRFERVAVTPEQVERYGLPTAPPKATDRRGDWRGLETVQAEALAPDQLRDELEAALRPWVDEELLARVLEAEEHERGDLQRSAALLVEGAE